MTRRSRFYALALMAACLFPLTMAGESLSIDFPLLADGFLLRGDGYSIPSFRPVMRVAITDDGRRFLAIQLARPYGGSPSSFILQPKNPPGNAGIRRVKELDLTLYGTRIPYRLGVLLADGDGRTLEYGMETGVFSGPRSIRLTVDREMKGLAFRGLVFYLDRSVPAGEHTVFIRDLVIKE